MKNNKLNTDHLAELLYQALETEKGGVQIYTTALRFALNDDLREEWSKYLEQTKAHVQIVSDILTGRQRSMCRARRVRPCSPVQHAVHPPE